MESVQFKRSDGRKLNFEIVKRTPQNLPSSQNTDRHRHEFHTIFFILEGTAVHEIDFEKYPLKRGQLVFVPKGAIHWEMERSGLTTYNLLFEDSFFASPMLQMVNSFIKYCMFQGKMVIDLTEIQMAEFLQLAEVIWQEHDQAPHQNMTFILQNLAMVWINKMESVAQGHVGENYFTTTSILFQQFVNLLDEHFRTQKGLDFYCTALGCTAKNLSASIIQVTGKTTNEAIIATVLIEAKRMLCYTNLSVKEIAFELGYESQYYFSRIFKKKEGLSPDGFRKRYAL